MRQAQVGIARIARPLAIASVAAIGWFTLRPNAALAEFVATTPVSCVVCGEEGASDLILNVLLFLPLGLALGLAQWRLVHTWLLGTALSVAIELTQYWILVGRDASLGDVLSNSSGALAGAVLGARLLRPLAPRSGRTLLASLVLAAIMLAVTGWALLPAPLSAAAWQLEIAPSEPDRIHYTGTIETVQLDEAAVPRGAVEAPAALEAILDRKEWHLNVRGRGGLIMDPEATVLELRGDGRLQFELDQEWCAFTFLPRRRAGAMRLHQVGIWADSPCRESGDDPFTLRATQSSRSLSLRVVGGGHVATTNVPLYLATGWVHFWPYADYLNPRRPAAEYVWVTLLFLPAGYVMPRRLLVIAATAAGGLLFLVGITLLLGLNPPVMMHYLGVLTGMLAGTLSRHLLIRLQQESAR